MTYLKYSVSIVLLLFAGACTTTTSVLPNTTMIDKPAIDTVSEAEIGSTMLEKGVISTYDGVALENDIGWGDGFILKKFTIHPGKLKAFQKDGKYTYYLSDNMTSYDAILGTSPYGAGGICANDTLTEVKGFIIAGSCGFSFKSQPILSNTKIVDANKPNFRQELIYNGRIGNSLSFVYREFSGDFIRAPFSQTVQYDLNESKIIGFKGVRIEVIDATNTKISYKVINSFPPTN